MIDRTKNPTSIEFSVLVLITFLLKIDIPGLAMLIQLYGDEGQVKFLQVLQLICACLKQAEINYSKIACMSCNDSVLNNNYTPEFSFATLVVKKKLTDDLLHLLDFIKLKTL